MDMTYTSKVLEILPNGDAVIELPPALLEKMGWKEGDKLEISQDEKKRVIVKKKNDN